VTVLQQESCLAVHFLDTRCTPLHLALLLNEPVACL
jgi:hypothetical protein